MIMAAAVADFRAPAPPEQDPPEATASPSISSPRPISCAVRRRAGRGSWASALETERRRRRPQEAHREEL